MKKIAFFIALLNLLVLSYLPAQTQKIPLTHDVYDNWRHVVRQQISNDGRWVSWEVRPQKGDGMLYLLDLYTSKLDSLDRGSRAFISPNSDFMAFLVEPPADVVRRDRLAGKSAGEIPGDSVGIYVFDRESNTRIGRTGSFSIAREESSWMVYLIGGRGKDETSTMVIFNPITRDQHQFEDVFDYKLSENGKLVLFVRKVSEPEDFTHVQVFNTRTRNTQVIMESRGTSMGLATSADGSQASFLHTPDTTGRKIYSLYHWEETAKRVTRIISPNTRNMPPGWSVSENFTPEFTGDGTKLFFGTAPKPLPPVEDGLLEDERFRVDIWHYRDPLIQPQQLAEAGDESKRAYVAVHHIEEARMIQLATPLLPNITAFQHGDGTYELGTSNLPYQIQNSFESGEHHDIYLVNTSTGEAELVLEKHRGSLYLSTTGDARLSPAGKYIIYYSQSDSNWHIISTSARNTRNITEDIPLPLYDELHDSPSYPGAYGIAGWVEDDSYVLIYDRFDIWKVDPEGEEEPVMLTNGYGRANNIRFRYIDPEEINGHIGRREEILLAAFNIRNKQSGFYNVRVHRPDDPDERIMDDALYHPPLKARDANVLIWKRSTFSDYPDLWASNTRFRNQQRLTTANPQQSRYLWGNANLVEWVSFTNDTLQGILYVPEGTGTNSRLPMIVYFYERLSDGLHRHFVPAPSRSTINIPYFVSNGYVVFVPDIPYTIGYPGQSAYNAIVSGAQSMADRFDFIDRHNTGIQGQSWAGYQIAYILTRTGMFRAAMAGAPVSNMISAYGGIRWRTGFSRIYQYEETQSRIGGTIWDRTLRYIENSPIFYADRITTPLLMMHNDADGAVPWYQGIELYMALRRLGKPAWMLNYNAEEHNLIRRANMQDLSLRMQQFFDHYLKGEPAPVWITDGIPATMKGRTDGYETSPSGP